MQVGRVDDNFRLRKAAATCARARRCLRATPQQPWINAISPPQNLSEHLSDFFTQHSLALRLLVFDLTVGWRNGRRWRLYVAVRSHLRNERCEHIIKQPAISRAQLTISNLASTAASKGTRAKPVIVGAATGDVGP